MNVFSQPKKSSMHQELGKVLGLWDERDYPQGAWGPVVRTGWVNRRMYYSAFMWCERGKH